MTASAAGNDHPIPAPPATPLSKAPPAKVEASPEDRQQAPAGATGGWKSGPTALQPARAAARAMPAKSARLVNDHLVRNGSAPGRLDDE